MRGQRELFEWRVAQKKCDLDRHRARERVEDEGRWPDERYADASVDERS